MNKPKDLNTFDPSYAERYNERNQHKISAIVRAMHPVQTMLDIGCNQGYVSQICLDLNLVQHVTGVELDGKVISPTLLANPRFQLVESDVVEFRFDQTYDVIVYTAVHHHIVGKYGLLTALEVWRDLVDHCNQYFFFETGLIAEVGDYYWKSELQKLFDHDSSHLTMLLNHIGPRLKAVTPIAQLPIHGTSRTLYKIDLHPKIPEFDLKAQLEQFYGSMYSTSTDWEPVAEFRRTVGSVQQRLLQLPLQPDEEENIFPLTRFFLLRNTRTREQAFAKKTAHDPYKEMREFMILMNTSHPRRVPLKFVHDSYGLVFPYLGDWIPLDNVPFARVKNRDYLMKELESFFEYAAYTTVSTGLLDLEPGAQHVVRTIGDIVDFHPHNFLVKLNDQFIVDWVVIDFEYFSNDLARRNANNLRRIRELINRKKFLGLI